MLKRFILRETQLRATGFGPCSKQPVQAMLKVLDGGKQFFGSNEMQKSPGKTCPRDDRGMVSGEGYELCQSECHQEFHAEYQAVERALSAKVDLRGSTMYLTGHHYCCDKCLGHMIKHGVKNVFYLDTNRLEDL